MWRPYVDLYVLSVLCLIRFSVARWHRCCGCCCCYCVCRSISWPPVSKPRSVTSARCTPRNLAWIFMSWAGGSGSLTLKIFSGARRVGDGRASDRVKRIPVNVCVRVCGMTGDQKTSIMNSGRTHNAGEMILYLQSQMSWVRWSISLEVTSLQLPAFSRFITPLRSSYLTSFITILTIHHFFILQFQSQNMLQILSSVDIWHSKDWFHGYSHWHRILARYLSFFSLEIVVLSFRQSLLLFLVISILSHAPVSAVSLSFCTRRHCFNSFISVPLKQKQFI